MIYLRNVKYFSIIYPKLYTFNIFIITFKKYLWNTVSEHTLFSNRTCLRITFYEPVLLRTYIINAKRTYIFAVVYKYIVLYVYGNAFGEFVYARFSKITVKYQNVRNHTWLFTFERPENCRFDSIPKTDLPADA